MVLNRGLGVPGPQFSAWGLADGGRVSLLDLETLGRRQEELFSVDSGSICGYELARAAGKLWVEQAGR